MRTPFSFLYLFKHFLQRFLFLNCGCYLCHAGGISQEDCTAKNSVVEIGSSQNLILFILDFNGFIGDFRPCADISDGIKGSTHAVEAECVYLRLIGKGFSCRIRPCNAPHFLRYRPEGNICSLRTAAQSPAA